MIDDIEASEGRLREARIGDDATASLAADPLVGLD